MNLFNIFKKKVKIIPKTLILRERLCILKVILTDKATYIIYETETLQGIDCVNIEIERIESGKSKLILEDEIFEESWGAMGGVAFSSLIQDAKNRLDKYIKENAEKILSEKP